MQEKYFAGLSMEEIKKNKNKVCLGVSVWRESTEEKNHFGIGLFLHTDSLAGKGIEICHQFMANGSHMKDEIESMKKKYYEHVPSSTDDISWDPIYVELNDLFK